MNKSLWFTFITNSYKLRFATFKFLTPENSSTEAVILYHKIQNIPLCTTVFIGQEFKGRKLKLSLIIFIGHNYLWIITYFATPSKKGYISLIVNNTTCCSEVWLSIAFVVLPQPTLPLFASFQTFLPESWPASAAYVRHFVPTKLLFRRRKYQSKTWIGMKAISTSIYNSIFALQYS